MDIYLSGSCYNGNVPRAVRVVFCTYSHDYFHSINHKLNIKCFDNNSSNKQIYFGISNNHFDNLLAKLITFWKLFGHSWNRLWFFEKSSCDCVGFMDTYIFG